MEAEQKADSDTELESQDKKTEKPTIDPLKLDAQYTPIDGFQEWASLPVDDNLWQQKVRALENRRASASAGDLDSAIEFAVRAAAVDSGAIEGLYQTDRGLTITIALKEADWQTKMRSHDERMPDFFEAQLEAYDLASEVASSREPVTEVWIRELQEVLCRPQATYTVQTPQGLAESALPKGEYKRTPNHVKQADGAMHAYAPVDLTPAEMHRLVDELNSTEFGIAHPVLQAAYAHYAFVAIHPFADGNGRVARALASVYLRRDSYIPLLILVERRSEYFSALEAADGGELQVFVDFVFDQGIDTFALMASELGPRPEELIEPLAKLYESYGGLTFQELDQKATKLIQHFVGLTRNVINELPQPSGFKLTYSVDTGGNTFAFDDPAYRQTISGGGIARTTLSTVRPANADFRVEYQVLVAQEEGARYPFRLMCSIPDVAPLEVRLNEVHPQLSDALNTKLIAWTRPILADALAELRVRAESALHRAGF